ncbi:MAG: radical SAM protein [bacterium]
MAKTLRPDRLQLDDRVAAPLKRCSLCGRRCGVDRTRGELGGCGESAVLRVARWLSHMGEEPPLSGARGSGTIFFSGCSLHCLFCQNHAISQQHQGEQVSVERLVEIMMELEGTGSHNVNLVSPTHFVPQAAAAIREARRRGLTVPVVYNSHGYDSREALALLDGLIDIYLPDRKYACNSTAEELSGVRGYREVNREALAAMFRQVGHLQEDARTGLAGRGMLVRILVLPGGLAGAKESLLELQRLFTPRLSISLMAQYTPLHGAVDRPPLDRTVTEDEYWEVVDFAQELGFSQLWIQEPQAAHVGVPDFSSETPFVFD